MDESWPYLLFLPANPHDLRTFLLEIFGSPITLEILEKIDRGVQAQKEIIRQLKHSNKTIISHLKNLVRLNVLEEKYRVEGGKRTIWYNPTEIGRWILLMFKRQLPSTDLEKVLEELFRSYLSNIVDLCLKKGIAVEKLENAFSTAIAKGLGKLQKKLFEPEVMVYGLASICTFLRNKRDMMKGVYDAQETLCGSGRSVVVMLAQLGVKVGFAGKVGGDTAGWRITETLIKEKVDISNLVTDWNIKTPKMIIVAENGEKKTYLLTPRTNFFLSDPKEINWELVKNAKAVCICEILAEIGELIASYAKSCKVKVFYNPPEYDLKKGISYIEGILRNTNFLVLSEEGWNILSKEVSSPSNLFELGVECLIVFKSVRDGCAIYTKSGRIEVNGLNIPVSSWYSVKEAFLAGFIKSILDGKSLEESARFGIATSAMIARSWDACNMIELKEVLKVLEGEESNG